MILYSSHQMATRFHNIANIVSSTWNAFLPSFPQQTHLYLNFYHKRVLHLVKCIFCVFDYYYIFHLSLDYIHVCEYILIIFIRAILKSFFAYCILPVIYMYVAIDLISSLLWVTICYCSKCLVIFLLDTRHCVYYFVKCLNFAIFP